MLILPGRNEALRVLGVDPGTAYVGCACLESFEHERTTVANAFTLVAKDNHPAYSSISDLHGPRVGRLMNLGDEFLSFLHEYRPHAVVVENNYLRASVEAFRALVESVCTIQSALYTYSPLMPLYKVDPSTVKKLAGIKGRVNDKDAVREALRKRTDLAWQVDLDSLDEHSVDAIPIGLYFIRQLLIG